MTAPVLFKELDVVEIPAEISKAHAVRSTGTIVWYVPPADYATVECMCLHGPNGWESELIDVNVRDLKLWKSGEEQ